MTVKRKYKTSDIPQQYGFYSQPPKDTTSTTCGCGVSLSYKEKLYGCKCIACSGDEPIVKKKQKNNL